MFKKLGFYSKLGYKLIRKDTVNKNDYRKDYDQLAPTYKTWLDEMGQFTDRIINLDYLDKQGKIKILDFACGTGYISRGLLEKGIDCQIRAVDYSDKMLEGLKGLNDDRIKIVQSDGIEFLENTEERYDLIYIGWALPYFNYRVLFNLFRRVLKPDGLIKIIANIQGTLSGIEDIFMEVMYKNHGEVQKPMDIRFNLPKGKDGLARWFNQYGFEKMDLEEDEILFKFNNAEDLLDWLKKTGAIAGTSHIFKSYDLVREDLLEEIRKRKYRDGSYEINHKFAYGTFRLR